MAGWLVSWLLLGGSSLSFFSVVSVDMNLLLVRAYYCLWFVIHTSLSVLCALCTTIIIIIIISIIDHETAFACCFSGGKDGIKGLGSFCNSFGRKEKNKIYYGREYFVELFVSFALRRVKVLAPFPPWCYFTWTKHNRNRSNGNRSTLLIYFGMWALKGSSSGNESEKNMMKYTTRETERAENE